MQLVASRAIAAAVEALPPAAVLIVDEDMRIVDADGRAFARHGLRAADIVGHTFTTALPEDARTEFVARYERALAGEPQSFDHWSADRGYGYWVRIAPLRREGACGREVVAVLHDITDRLREMTELERSQNRLQEAERLGGVGSWELATGSERITYSPGYALLLGLDPDDELTLAAFYAMVLPEDRGLVEEAIAACLRDGSGSCEYRLRRRDGSVRTFHAQGETLHRSDPAGGLMIGTITDVTEERAAEAERAAALALFEQGFDAAPIGMVLTDPQSGRYVRVNDAMCEMLGRSREEVLGHSFEDFTHPDDLRGDNDGREQMLSGGRTSFQGEKRYLRADGTAAWATLHVTPVRRADGTVETFFSQIVDISARKEREERMKRDIADAGRLAQIRRALDEDGLVLHAQPIVDLATGATVQNELLLRLLDEEGTLHLPGEFLPVAERYGLISELDRWVVCQAVRLAAEGTPAEFNISAHSLDDPDVLRELERGLKETGADPSLLVIEVTETAVVDQLEEGRRFAERICELGCTLALDDFGTGFANLAYLKHIPAQQLKIDMEFVRELSRSETDQRLVEGIVAFARAFDQMTIAEGVEDEATLVLLRELGVDMAQGFLLGRPCPLNGRAPGEARANGATERCADPVERVRAAFAAFADRDVEALERLSAADMLLYPAGTADLVGRRRPYRGHAGLREYFADAAAAWRRLELRPRRFLQSADSVIVFGEVEGETAAGESPAASILDDVIWVWRLRGEEVASVEAFHVPHQGAG